MLIARDLCREFHRGRDSVTALDGVSLEVSAGEFVCIRGPSGSGKSTLLLALGGMLHPTGGKVEWKGQDLYAMSAGERARFRAREIGFVFQMFHLLPYLDVEQNVRLAAPAAGPDTAARARAQVEHLGLGHRLRHRPAELSAGERQRVAVARALFPRPGLVLADEPTGNLDPENGARVLEDLAVFRQEGGTVIVVTHGVEAATHADRTLVLEAGRLRDTGTTG